MEVPDKTEDEPWYLVIGMINGNHWSAVITYRGTNIRLIFVRRSRNEEGPCMKAKAFDKQFDEGEDMTAFLDLSKARRVSQEQKRVNVDFPLWVIDLLDREAGRPGIKRQSIIKY